MKESKTQAKLKKQTGFTASFTSGFLDIHKHRYFRRIFCSLLICHIFTLLIPDLDLPIQIPEFFRPILTFLYQIWPLPTAKLTSFFSGSAYIYLRNIIFKSFEILVLLLYTVDLLPKIFVWKKPLIWKMINVLVVTMMVIQVPLTMSGYMESGKSVSKLKIRTFSIGLSFLLLLEIMSIREQRHMKLMRNKIILDKERQTRVTTLTLKQSVLSEKPQPRLYSWAEIIKHDKPGDCWIVIHGKVYDLSNFVDQHPGGPMIYDGAGGDCTSMFESYHPLYLTKQGPPVKYYIGDVRNYTSFYSWDGGFFRIVKERVEKQMTKTRRRTSISLFIKAFVILAVYLYSVFAYVYYNTAWAALLYCAAASQLGVNIMHDGNHGAFSTNKWISYLAGYTLDLTGSTSQVYRRSHNFGHHGCVNHLELDRSFDTSYPIFRMHKLQPRFPMHKYQHIYMWLIYGMINFGDLFGTFDELSRMSNYPIRKGHVTNAQYYGHVFTKITWLMLSMLIPSYIHGWYNVFPIWFLYMTTFSYGYALFFAVNHWTEEANQVDNTNITKTNWGVLQVENSSNFAIDSTFWTHLSGGLNHQIEHHLFPSYAHPRYPEIRKIVQDTCAEFNIRYFSFKSFWHAMKSHYDLLKRLGTED